MPRTKEEIKAALDSWQDIDTVLPPSGGSSTSVLEAIKNIFAAATAENEAALEPLEDALEATGELVPGTTLWWIAQAKAFQFGDALVFEGYVPSYATEDESKQIVKNAAVEQTGPGAFRLKIGKLDASGLHTPLSAAELTAFEGYVADIKDAGPQITIVNQAADVITLTAIVYYNGQLQLSAFQGAVEKAIDDYLQGFSTAQFNGQFRRSELENAIQAVAGTTDVTLDSWTIDPATSAPVNDQERFTFEAGAGICTTKNITYIPE